MRAMLIIMLLLLSGGVAVAYEEPVDDVVEQYDEFELRHYVPQLVVETEVTGEFGEIGNRAFRILAGFISGQNRRQQEIAMTAPVTQAPADGDTASYVFTFVMPSRYTRETLPEPLDPRVRVRELPARFMAARRFSGSWPRALVSKQRGNAAPRGPPGRPDPGERAGVRPV